MFFSLCDRADWAPPPRPPSLLSRTDFDDGARLFAFLATLLGLAPVLEWEGGGVGVEQANDGSVQSRGRRRRTPRNQRAKNTPAPPWPHSPLPHLSADTMAILVSTSSPDSRLDALALGAIAGLCACVCAFSLCPDVHAVASADGRGLA